MARITKNTRSIRGIVSVGIVALSYLLVRFPLFEMHGMKDWPDLLAILSIVIIVMASILKKRRVFVGVIVGYLGGFILAMIFRQEGFDAGGGATSNGWIIWTVFFLFSIALAILWSLKEKH